MRSRLDGQAAERRPRWTGATGFGGWPAGRSALAGLGATGWPAQAPRQGRRCQGPRACRPDDGPGAAEQAKIGPLSTVRSRHYVATGDAAEAFMKLIVTDCEQLARDYEHHFREPWFPGSSSPTSR